MPFLTQRCPNCAKAIAKDAAHCNACGCAAANTWSTCPRCAASVGSDSRFCWKCGGEQNPEKRAAFYGDRWHRSPTDFAVRVEIAVPEKTLHHGIQVEDGTLAVVFQSGKFTGILEAGYHTFDTFMQRLIGADKGKAIYAILVDTKAAEVDFALAGIRCLEQVPVDVRLRLLFQVTDVKRFVETFFRDAQSFETTDLIRHYEGAVREVTQIALARKPLEELVCEVRTREIVENDLIRELAAVLAEGGLAITGVRLADFVGPAIETVREKLGEISRLNRENDLNRRVQELLRADKVTAFRDEQDLQDAYEKATHEYGFKAAERDLEKKRFVTAAEHTDTLEKTRRDYEVSRLSLVNELDAQTLKHQADITALHHELGKRALIFERDMAEQATRFEVAQKQQVGQAKTDTEVAREGVEALKLVQGAKHEQRRRDDELELEVEAKRLQMRGDASLQALLATVPPEQADRLLKFAELEMRKGLGVEQALALVVEKSPEIAPAIAQALVARYQNPEKKK